MMYRDNTAYDFDLFTPKKREVVEIPVHKNKKRTKTFAVKQPMVVLSVVATLILIIAQLHCQLQLSETVDKISQTEKNIEILQSENTRLQTEINGKISFTNMEQSAKEMGMQKITAAQTEYIHLCDEDASEVVENNTGLLASVRDAF